MRPNILLLLPDQWRGDWMPDTPADLPLRLPTLTKLASQGTVFEHAFSPSPLCAPARACFASGMRYPRCGVSSNQVDYPEHIPTLYQHLRTGGYQVMGCGKFDLHKASYTWGPKGKNSLDSWGFSDGIDNEGKIDGIQAYRAGTPGPYLTFLEGKGVAWTHVEDFESRGIYGTAPTAIPDELYGDNYVAANAAALLDAAPTDKPWFLQVNFTGPHFPFDVTHAMYEWYKDTAFPPPYLDDERKTGPDHLAIRRNYAAMMQNIDRRIADLLNHPRIAGDDRPTIIIFSSDHGEMLGDHGYYGKCKPFNGSLHIPMIMQGPGILADNHIGAPVSLLDLSATILELAQTEIPSGMESRSLVPCLTSEAAPEGVVTASLAIESEPHHCWKAIMDPLYKYILWADGHEALYALDDYTEAHNLIASHREAADSLRIKLQESLHEIL